MTTEWPQHLTDQFNRHCDEHHNADYEVCDNPACAAAFAEELRRGLIVETSPGVYELAEMVDAMTYRQPTHPVYRRWARAAAYRQLTPEERAEVDAVMLRVQANVPRSGPVIAAEIVAAIGELLAAGRVRE